MERKTYLKMMMMMMPLEFSCLPIITSEYLSMYLALIGWLGVTISILCAAKIHIFIGRRRVLQKKCITCKIFVAYQSFDACTIKNASLQSCKLSSFYLDFKKWIHDRQRLKCPCSSDISCGRGNLLACEKKIQLCDN